MKGRTRGFSLLELSVIVLLLGMLAALLWPLAGAHLQQREKATSQALLEQVDWALTGFILSRHRLPCPASTQNGEENCAGGREVGYLPYKTLGVADARAQKIRYGVLRRTLPRVVDDPEAEDSDPKPALPRTADLTEDADQFYPLLATIGSPTEVFANPSGASLPTLETSGKAEAPPITTYQPVQSWNVMFGEKNGLDFCFRLRVAEDPLPVSAKIKEHVHVLTPAGARQPAYALALPGALETGAPDVSNEVFVSPRVDGAHSGDARVYAVTPGALWKRLECGEALASVGHAQPNLATAAVMLYRGLFDFEQTLEQARYLSEVQSDLADMGYTNATIKLATSAPAQVLKITANIVSGKGTDAVALGKAIYAISITTIALGASQASQESSARSLEMANSRYGFVRRLRGQMKTFSEELLQQARLADRRGLYQGKP